MKKILTLCISLSLLSSCLTTQLTVNKEYMPNYVAETSEKAIIPSENAEYAWYKPFYIDENNIGLLKYPQGFYPFGNSKNKYDPLEDLYILDLKNNKLQRGSDEQAKYYNDKFSDFYAAFKKENVATGILKTMNNTTNEDVEGWLPMVNTDSKIEFSLNIYQKQTKYDFIKTNTYKFFDKETGYEAEFKTENNRCIYHPMNYLSAVYFPWLTNVSPNGKYVTFSNVLIDLQNNKVHTLYSGGKVFASVLSNDWKTIYLVSYDKKLKQFIVEKTDYIPKI